MGDLAYNLLLLPAVAGALLWTRRRGAVLAPLALLAGAAFALASLVALALFEGDPFAVMRLLAFGVFVDLPLFLGGAARLLRRRRWAARASLAGMAGLLLVAADAFLVEPRWLEVTRLRLETEKIDRPVRIVVVADLQTDRVGAWELRVLETAMAERPDLVLLPGDYVQTADPGRYEELSARLRELLREVDLEAPLGVFAVQGNADWHGRWVRIFAGRPLTPVVRTESFDLGPLTLTALSLFDSFEPELAVARRRGFHVVFGHAPDFALGRVEADLLVAGHTHGGQVRLPLLGPVLTFSAVPRSWAAGVTALDGGRTLVVSRGVGMERRNAPRLRFLCRPELVVIDVVPRGARPAG